MPIDSQSVMRARRSLLEGVYAAEAIVVGDTPYDVPTCSRQPGQA